MEDRGLAGRIKGVRARIDRAAERAGRPGAKVELMAVTKGHPAGVLSGLVGAGIRLIGENRVGEAAAKLEEGGRLGLRWHMVGHLQRNKAARAVALFDAVDSVDSLRLARKLEREVATAPETGLAIAPPLEVLVQVNASGEESKGGFSADGALENIAAVCALPHLRVAGLMTMAPLEATEPELRRVFGRMRELFERCDADIDAFEARVLSMGMSADYPIAVEEGSTRVRLGTALLGPRPGEPRA